jgi:hypothetical protein
LALLFRVEGIVGSQARAIRVWGPWPSIRGQDARDTQGRDALATQTSGAWYAPYMESCTCWYTWAKRSRARRRRDSIASILMPFRWAISFMVSRFKYLPSRARR